MLKLFLISTRRLPGLIWRALMCSPDGQSAPGWHRRGIMLLFIPLFLVVQGIHWLGFLLDAIFIRRDREVEIRQPLFVLGVPRSGTTNLHQVLARDEQFTTFSSWECLFALSVTERLFWRALGRLDARLGGWATRLVARIERRAFSSLDEIHAMGLKTPEEDYFALTPALSCFILALPFPGSAHLWHMGSFDRDMPPEEARLILDFYHRCLQKHLYVNGPEKRLLSKNAAFAPLALSLAQRFPDAGFLICLRDPLETLPSQLSAIAPGLRLFGVPPDSPVIRDRFIDQLAFYYDNLDRLSRAHPERTFSASLPAIKLRLAEVLTQAYDRLGLPLSDDFRLSLAAETAGARRYQSGHRYSLEQFGLDAKTLEDDFSAARESLARLVAAEEQHSKRREDSDHQGMEPHLTRIQQKGSAW